jgi:hypothetical protein
METVFSQDFLTNYKRVFNPSQQSRHFSDHEIVKKTLKIQPANASTPTGLASKPA